MYVIVLSACSNTSIMVDCDRCGVPLLHAWDCILVFVVDRNGRPTSWFYLHHHCWRALAAAHHLIIDN